MSCWGKNKEHGIEYMHSEIMELVTSKFWWCGTR